MKNMNKVLAISVLAITAVSSANAKIVSESLLTSTPGTYTSTNTVEAAIADAKAAGEEAVQSVGTGSANGTISVDGSDVAVKGLKSAAYTESSAYATAAQGTLATNAVPNTRTVNSKALSSNITLNGADVKLDGYSKASSVSAVATTDTVNAAIGKLEKALDGKQASGSYQTTGNMKKSDDANLNGSVLESDTYYLSAKGTAAVITDKLDERQAGHTSKGSATVPVYFDSTGTAQPITSYSGKAATAGTADTANAVAWGNVTDKPSTFTPSDHASSKVTSMSGYSKPSSTSAISTSDSLNTAIGKLEKALDGKQASGSYVNATVSGDASKVMVRNSSGAYKPATSSDVSVTTDSSTGAATLTVSHATSADSATTATTASTANAVAWGNVTDKPSTFTPSDHASSKVTSMSGYSKPSSTSAISTSDSLNTAIGKLEKALDAKQATANMKKSDDANLLGSVSESDTYYLSAKATDALITDRLDERQEGHTSKGSASLPVYFDSTGTAQTITSYQGTAENAKNIPVKSGSTITSYAAIWVE